LAAVRSVRLSSASVVAAAVALVFHQLSPAGIIHRALSTTPPLPLPARAAPSNRKSRRRLRACASVRDAPARRRTKW